MIQDADVPRLNKAFDTAARMGRLPAHAWDEVRATFYAKACASGVDMSHPHAGTYLVKTAMGVIARAKAKSAKARMAEVASLDDPSLYLQPSDKDAYRSVEAWSVLEGIAALATPRQREALELRARGMTFAEVAERMGVAENTVRNLLDALWQRAQSAN